MHNNQELLSLLAEMAKAARCCQQENTFCDGLTFTQFNILNLVGKHGTLRLSDLHDLLSVEKSTSTRLIEPLVQRGLIKKERSACDCRAIDLILTDKGRETSASHWSCLNNFLDRLWAEIPEDKREEVYRGVVIFLNAIKKAF